MRIQKKELRTLAKLFEEHSPLFVVGGFVRNKILNIPSSDIDLCSFCSLDEVNKILKDTEFTIVTKNKKLNTAEIHYKNETYEYSTFREEFYEGGKHNPSIVKFDTNIVQDAKRRDFTINCIYYSLSTHEVIDFYGGTIDLNKKQIKTIETPESVLKDDGARILRLARFASELSFKVEKNTFKTAKQYVKNIEVQSGKTKLQELTKVLSANDNYKNIGNFEIGIKILDKLDAWKYIFKNNEILRDIKKVFNKLNATIRKPNLEHFIYDLFQYYNKKQKTTIGEFRKIFLNSLN